MKIPLLRPNPPRLSQLGEDLQVIEASGIFSNYGPVNTRLESAFVEKLFGGQGACLTVCNATIGLMLAIRQVVPENPGERRYALMPSFTFSATAQAALWVGLTPLFCDVDEETWMLSHEHVQNLIESYRDKIAVIIPYATFGNCLDIQYYEELSAREGIPLVIDAAASLGSRTIKGEGFASGSQIPVVFSMHATKTFAVAEAGLIYSTNGDLINELRAMANFGFETPRISTKIGLNGKLSEVIALMALKKLEGFEGVVARRELLANGYRRMLPEMQSQRMTGSRHAYQFMSLLLPESHAARRKKFLQLLTKKGIGWATYGSPHLAEHPYFKERCPTGPLETTNKIARRIVSLPMSDQMSMDELETVGERVRVSLVESLDTH
jgi:dTDP-4-amino-4,6-dideoxygalactose transaminase